MIFKRGCVSFIDGGKNVFLILVWILKHMHNLMEPFMGIIKYAIKYI